MAHSFRRNLKCGKGILCGFLLVIGLIATDFVKAAPLTGLAIGSPAWTAEGGHYQDFFGNSMASAGDVNGDGFDDVIVGAYGFDHGQTDEGRIFLYMGSATGLLVNPSWTAEGDQENLHFGVQVSGVGDINSDGYDDVIVLASGNSNPAVQGRTFLYLGSSAGLSTPTTWNGGVGIACGVGDVNRDGYDDVLIGDLRYNNFSGQIRLFLGSAAGLPSSPNWTVEGTMFKENFGSSVAGAGDVNGDGYADMLVGTGSYTNGQEGEGWAGLYLGSGGVISKSPAWTVESNQAWASFGYCVAGAGDVNGDGYDDTIIGAPEWQGEGNRGQAFLYLGSATGLSLTHAWTVQGNIPDTLGFSVAGVGDANGDGKDDVIVSLPSHSTYYGYPEWVYYYSGTSTGLVPLPEWKAMDNQIDSDFGYCVAGAGDVNGDGFDDFLVGAPGYPNGGRAYLYLGSTSVPVELSAFAAD